MKRTAILLIFALLLCACQPTPEVDAVKQKDTNVLIDTVKTDQQEQQNAAAALPPVKEQFPERFTCDFTTSQQDVRVKADVPIDVLTDDVFPMLRVERRYLSDAERLTLASRALGTDELYVWEDQITRKDLENMIRDLMQEPTPEEKAEWMREWNGTETGWQQMLENRKAMLEEYQRQYNELPADDSRVPLQKWDGSAPTYSRNYEIPNYARIVRDRLPEGYFVYQDWIQVFADELDHPMDFSAARQSEDDMTDASFFGGAHKEGTVYIDKAEYDKPHEGASVTPNDAIRMVQNVFSGIADLKPAAVYWANNAATDGDTKGMYTRWGYLICFSQDFGGAYAPYCESMALENGGDAEYVRSWFYESLRAVVDGEGNLIAFSWRAPSKVTNTVAESTPLLPTEEILKIFETQVNRMFVYDDQRNGRLTVDGVQLGLFRIREKNDMDSGLMVPVWFFTGVFDYSKKTHDARLKQGFNEAQASHAYYDSLNPLLIVNAIDGSIIDPMKGY